MEHLKSYTDIEQSKVLAKILSMESVDMNYWCGSQIRIGGYRTMDKDLDIPCWSLAALLTILPKYEIHNNGITMQVKVDKFSVEVAERETLLDAVVNMIIKLHKNKIL